MGGIVVMLSFLTTSMQASYQRYYAYALGEDNRQKVLDLFHCSLTVQLTLSLFILLIAESIGLWFLNSKMVIVQDRLTAANWVYQASIISFLLAIIKSPFSAIVISHERMDWFAYISVFDAVLKLLIVLMLRFIEGDKLIYYSLLMLLISFTEIILYISICVKKLNVYPIRLGKDKEMISSLASFGGWGMMDTLAYTLKGNGLNIVLNLFFGTVVNAARGIAFQVSNAVNQFISAFQSSFRPQMTKSYAAGDIMYLKKIYYSCTKLSYYLIISLSLPIMLDTDYILQLWLVEVPEHTVSFTRLILATSFVSAFANPTSGIAFSTGNIKWFTICVSSVNLMIVPVAYLFLKLGFSAESSMVVSLVLTIFAQIVRLFVVRHLAPMPIYEYMKMVVRPTMIYTVLVPIVPLLFIYNFEHPSFLRLMITTLLSIICSFVIAWYFGLTKNERQFVISKAANIFKKRKFSSY